MKVYLDSIGCRLNQAEIEQYARQFHAAGHTLVPHPEEADLAVVNTCAVTNAAASDSRQKIRQVARAGVDGVIVTGCWSTLKPEQAAALPGVRQVVPNSEKDHLVPDLLQVPAEIFEQEPIAARAHPRGTAAHTGFHQGTGRVQQPLHVLRHYPGTRRGTQPPGRRNTPGHPRRPTRRGRRTGNRAHWRAPGLMGPGFRAQDAFTPTGTGNPE